MIIAVVLQRISARRLQERVNIRNSVIAKSTASWVSRSAECRKGTQFDIFKNLQSWCGNHWHKRFSWITVFARIKPAPSPANTRNEQRLLVSGLLRSHSLIVF